MTILVVGLLKTGVRRNAFLSFFAEVSYGARDRRIFYFGPLIGPTFKEAFSDPIRPLRSSRTARRRM